MVTASLLMERRGWQNLLSYSFYIFGGCQFQRKEYTINISVANCSPHSKNPTPSFPYKPPPKKNKKSPSQITADSFITLQERPLPNLSVLDPVLPSRILQRAVWRLSLAPKDTAKFEIPEFDTISLNLWLRPIQHRRLAIQDPSFLLPRHQHSVFGAIASQALLFQMMP